MDRLREEIVKRMKAKGLSPRALSKLAGGSLTLIRDILEYRVRNPKHSTLAGIARALDCSVAELTGESDETAGPWADPPAHEIPHAIQMGHPDNLPPGPAEGIARIPKGAIGGAVYSAPDLPILGSARGGLIGRGQLFDNGLSAFTRTFRPAYLLNVKNAYAVHIVGDSMSPALKHGHLAYVDPSKPPQPGDDVVIVQTTGEWFVKELVRRTEKKLVARQHNPPMTLDYPSDTVEAVHLIMGVTRVEI